VTDSTADNRRPAFSGYADARETGLVVVSALAVGLLTALVFSVRPDLDIAVSKGFGGAAGAFSMAGETFWQSLRTLFLRGFTLWYVVIVAAWLLSASRRAPVLNLSWERWFYMVLCSLTGPLLLVNIVLKEHWGRWRPREIFELGGSEIFTPVLSPAGTCFDNCSFVSGEVASMAMAFMALAFSTRHWRPIHYALAVAMGALEALIRVGQGGHFLSDAIFACVFMVLIAAGIYAWLFLSRFSPLPYLRSRLK